MKELLKMIGWRRCLRASGGVLCVLGVELALASVGGAAPAAGRVDYSRDVRPILSGKCFTCHGPDAEQRKGSGKGLRLDTIEGQRADLGGSAAVVPGKPEASDMIRRIVTEDEDDRMPPLKTGKVVEARELEVLRRWIAQGAEVAGHWSYVKPVRPAVPEVAGSAPPAHPIDRFVAAGLATVGLQLQPEADRRTLGRRVALDLTGLPPEPAELEAFVRERGAGAYERWVDRMLAKEGYGEHWARFWLDLARYADSAGYADDPPRTIWAYRDYVIRAFNRNVPFDRFTLEQLAGDLLPEGSEEALIATAFHRNTMTNNEGGTSDEEFRSAAIVDRVNTTFAVWMGTSMACAQCHTHKYDPITQKEYFQLYAFFNNTADADRPDETPVHEFYTRELRERRERVESELRALDERFRARDPEWVAAAGHWARVFPAALAWDTVRPATTKSESGLKLEVLDDASVRVQTGGDVAVRNKDTYTIAMPFDGARRVTGLRIEALADDGLPERGPGLAGNFVVRRVRARVVPVPNQPGPAVRYVRIELPAKRRLRLGEVEVFGSGRNLATGGVATQSSTEGGAEAGRAVDGHKPGETQAEAEAGMRFAATQATGDTQWWELDLGGETAVERVMVWGVPGFLGELEGFRVAILDGKRTPVWESGKNPAPKASVTFDLLAPRDVELAEAGATYNQDGFDESEIGGVTLPGAPSARRRGRATGAERGWSVGGKVGRGHALHIAFGKPVEVPQGATLEVVVEQQGKAEREWLGRFRVGVTGDERVVEYVATPADVLNALAEPEAVRDQRQQLRLVEHFVRYVAPGLRTERERHAALERERESIRPMTVPVMRELAGDKRRKTLIQLRGNYLVTADEVEPEVPAAWPPLPSGVARDRLALARWLVSADNPLTARVMVNRFWEQVFGVGLVRTSEEFGAQGDAPSHPALLDWLACEFMDSGWDVKQLLRMLVTSQAYRQSSRVTPEALEKDPDNRLLSRAPRFRMQAETVRDQALAVAGLLSQRSGGPSVRPPRPSLGLSAAFGGNLDWQPSQGAERFRRGVYTEWRRTSPYPSMATFDAPSREVCTLRRNRSNTPLQALVTLNDPVYVEAARGLAQEMMAAGGSVRQRIDAGFRRVLARPPRAAERRQLAALAEAAMREFAAQPERAKAFTGEAADAATAVEVAAWTTVGNVLLNLDETLMRR